MAEKKITEAILEVAYKKGPLTRDELAEEVHKETGKNIKIIKAWIGRLVKRGTVKEVEIDGQRKRLKLVEEDGKLKAVEV